VEFARSCSHSVPQGGIDPLKPEERASGCNPRVQTEIAPFTVEFEITRWIGVFLGGIRDSMVNERFSRWNLEFGREISNSTVKFQISR
jgi:hypothetical protein